MAGKAKVGGSEMLTLTAGVSSEERTYVGQDEEGSFIIVTESALKAMNLGDYLYTVSCIPELWEKEWNWEHPIGGEEHAIDKEGR